MTWQLLTEEEAADRCRLSADTLQRYRQTHVFVRGVHWQQFPGGSVRYHEGALLEWFATLHDAEAAQRAVEAWQRQLLSNKRKRRA